MTLDATEAARALDEIDDARARVARLANYRQAAPHFIMWGVVWLIGNGALEFSYTIANYVWPALILCAVIGAIVLGKRQGDAAQRSGERSHQAYRRTSAQIGMMIALAFGVVAAAAAVFWPVTPREMNAFISLAAGFAYIGAGVVAGWRMMAVGFAVVALVLVGHLMLEQHYYAWMAVVGGGALILGGLWLRKV